MKKLLLCALIVAIFPISKFSVAQIGNFHDTAALYFEELRSITKKYQNLWDLDLYAPMMFANPLSREVYSNFADSGGILSPTGAVYTGILPKTVNISNTSVKWNGIQWAMVMLPIPADKRRRVNLLTHELFHSAQEKLGFEAFNPENSHLDMKDGRIYLRLELEALKKAIIATSDEKIQTHTKHALLFRKYRYTFYPKADSTENLLELNEGICEYTGVMMSDRTEAELKDHFVDRIDFFISSSSYIRSFAYETVPVYGYLLSLKNKSWNKSISIYTNLTNYFEKAFSIQLSSNDGKQAAVLATQYNGDLIMKEEAERAERKAKQILDYRNRFVDSPHVEIPIMKMNMSFDYTVIFPLDNLGTVYPSIRITDVWGILEAERGVLISPEWNRVNVGYPTKMEDQKISGDGWKLELNEGYFIQKEGKNYVVRKR